MSNSCIIDETFPIFSPWLAKIRPWEFMVITAHENNRKRRLPDPRCRTENVETAQVFERLPVRR